MLSVGAFGLLALTAELVGRSLTQRIDVGRHIAQPGYAGTEYYPILVGAVKVGIALLLARLAWRTLKAWTAERGARRILAAAGVLPARRTPRVRLTLSPRLWLAFFALTSVIFLVQTDAEQAAGGRWPLLHPWLHSSALPVFAVLAVLCAFGWGVVRRWLADFEEYAQETVARAMRLATRSALTPPRRPGAVSAPPRRLFGLAFESRPPPPPLRV